MAENITVEREDGPDSGRYFVAIAEGAVGEMTFRKVAPGVLSIDHTGVPRAYRGSGVAQAMMDRAIADARAEGTRIVPLCSYVAAQFRRHPDWSDLLAD
jgi:predicted GNAT family acetyltransferase